MILPLFGFVSGCLVFGVIGAILLRLLPSFDLSLTNLILFVCGAVPGALLLSFLYGKFLVDAEDQLTSTIAVLGMFATIIAGGVAGGLIGASLGRRVLISVLPSLGGEKNGEEV